MASVQPSEIPSLAPSSSPTSQPSAPPSNFPTSLPTLECHDHQSYRSPINALTCEDHQGTNCVHWRILGLNTTELAKLIEQCPETCQIPCGTFVQFSVSLGFTVARIPSLMDANTKNDLEVVTRQHLLAFIRANLDRRISFEFDKVELVSQAVLQDISSRRPHLRRLQVGNAATTTVLEVRMEFHGFTIGISHREASKLLITGIDSESYEVSLQAADDFFSNAIISSAAIQNVPIRRDKDNEQNKGVLPATIVLSMLFAILISVLGAWSWFHHRHSGKWLPTLRIFYHSDIDGNFQVHHPIRFAGLGARTMASLPNRHNTSSMENVSSMLSFDDSRASTLQAGNGAPLMRLLASMSLSQSRSSADISDEIQNDELGTMSARPTYTEAVPIEHPLSNIIPPMIVIDNIDDGNREIWESMTISSNQKTPQVPARMIEASEGLVAALRDRRGRGNQELL
jgi:hypothetical protein